MFCYIPVALHMALAKLLVNWGSQSEMMRLGIPNQAMNLVALEHP
jgi:hypothetical protein